MKKCTVIAIVFVLVVSCVSVAFAAENDKISCSDDQSGVLYSEAEMILLSEMDGQQLERKGFTQSEIRDIKKIDYRELILQRAALPYETLRGYGYSDEQIRILKDYKGEEITKNSPVLMATAKVTASPYITTYSRSKIGIRYEWSWNVRPLYCKKDEIAAKWRSFLTNGRGEGKAVEAFALVRYYNVNTGSEDHLKRVNASTSTYKEAANLKFNMLEVVSNETWAKKGTFYLTIENTVSNGKMDHITVLTSYGHMKVSCTVSINIVDDVVFPIFLPHSDVDTIKFNEVLAYYDGRLTKK